MSLQPLRIAVIGAGHLGRWHAQQLSTLPDVELVAICDPDPRCRELADRYGCALVQEAADLDAGGLDGATIAAPTTLHHDLARHFLERDVPCLVEKPLAATVSDARALCELAEGRGVLLQVGHIERFNPALRAVAQQIRMPRFLEAVRLAPYPFRATDVGVILDLMIHDLEIVIALVQREIRVVRAWAAPVFSDTEDLAAAWIEFEGGACAQLKAVRAALHSERRLRVYQDDGCLEVDFLGRTATMIRRRDDVDPELVPSSLSPDDLGGMAPVDFVRERLVTVEQPAVDVGANPLRDELAAFAASIRLGTPPLVGGRDGLRAIEAAERVRTAAGLG
ncbi:MAG: Gfo/Idh/MocA family oxidoreductase [Candidatus Krumholzibacteriia bacterium]